jgi:hypothetical protein
MRTLLKHMVHRIGTELRMMVHPFTFELTTFLMYALSKDKLGTIVSNVDTYTDYSLCV